MTARGWEAYNRRMDRVLVFWLLVQLALPPLWVWWHFRYGRHWR